MPIERMASSCHALTLVICLSLLAVVSPHTWVHCTKYQATSTQDFGNYNDGLCAGYPRAWTAQDNLPFGATSQDFVHTYPLFSGSSPFQPMYTPYPGRAGEFRACFKDPTYNGRYQPATYMVGERVCLAYPSENHVPNRGCTYNPFTDLGQRVYYQRAGRDPTITEVDRLPSIALPPYGSNCPNYCQNTQQSLCTACFTVPQLAAGRYTFIWKWSAVRLRSSFNPNVFPQTPISYFTCWEVNIQAGGVIAPPPRPNPPPSNTFRLGALSVGLLLTTDYFISPIHAPGQCLDASATHNGAAVTVYACHGGDNQKWSLQVVHGINYALKDKRSGRVLDVPVGAINGQKATLWDRHNGLNQQFQLLDEGAGKYGLRVMSFQETAVLDVPAWGKDGVQVQSWQYLKGTNQMWTFHKA